MADNSRYKIRADHYDGGFSIGTHTEDLFDEGGPTDGGVTDETNGKRWTDGGRTEAEELQFMGASVVNVFGGEEREDALGLDDLADAWLKAHEGRQIIDKDTSEHVA